MMFKNYLKTAFRNLLKYKGFSFINIVGLGIGVACCLMIMLFVQDELSYDRYHEKADQIYRIRLEAVLNNNAFNGVVSCTPLKQALIDEFPEVETATRVRNYGFPVFRYQDKIFSEEKVFWADSTFFDVFKVRVLKGNPKTALTQPNNIVLTESMAKKYFGDEDPMGKQIDSDHRRVLMVAGVIEDVPPNSHFHYDFLSSLYNYNVDEDVQWVSNNFYTYLVLKKGTNIKEFEDKLFESVKTHVNPQIQAALGITIDQFMAGGGVYRYYLQPVTDIHLHSNYDFEIEPNGNFAYILIFSAIAFGILLVACINFINLSTARASNRAKEVGIRKTVGSTRGQLIRQFLTEAIFMSLLAVIIATVIVNLMLPAFNTLAGKQLTFSLFSNPATILSIVGLIILIGLLAGLYPAFFLASFNPVSVIKGEKSKGGRRALMRNILVVFQFTISIVLMISTIVVRRQVDYIQNTDLGFDKENIVIIHKTDDLSDRLRSFKLSLLENTNVISATNSFNLIGNAFGNSVFRVVGQSGEKNQLIWTLRTDNDFLKTYKIEMFEGRFFEENREADLTGCILNKSAVTTLGLENPVGKELTFPGDDQRKMQILGVIKDFHFESMHQEIRPLIIFPKRPDNSGRYLSVKINPKNIQGTLAFIEETWRKVADNQTFEYEFFDDHFAKIYRTEEQTAQIFFSFSILAIIIASLGLFGLSAFIAEQRTKEIGIRKVLGATVPGITSLLIQQFIKWIIIANVIAWPVAWFIMRKWLQNFAYQSSLGIWIFLISAFLALIIAIITVSYQSIKVAIADPVKSIRYE